jgi:RsiW-degrading membrane proteinase PrsW (M82 family)
MVYIILFAAVLPAFVLVWLIYRKDKLQPEPISQLIKAALWGIASVFVSFLISTPLSLLFGEGSGIGLVDSAYTAFCLAAIPEEVAKFLCLFLFLRKNKYFDEYMDGIVYAVCVSMGFAGIENILYLFSSENWAAVGVTRALISVPGHYAFAVLMGYYYSHWHILKDPKSKLLMLAAPILAHGIFDFLLMWAPYVDSLYTILTLAFFFFISKMHKYCSKLIARQREIDVASMAAQSCQNTTSGESHTQND